MTVSQLYNSVARLGFEDSLEDETRFILTANRALLQVSALRPATSAYVINHKPMPNKVIDASFEPIEKTDDLCFYASDVKSYYFEVDGNGVCYIEKMNEDDTWKPIGFVEFSVAKGFETRRGFIKDNGAFFSGAVRLRFTGSYVYSVKCVAMYEYLYSDNPKDVPEYEAFTKYDISKLTTDFLSFSCPPIIETDGIKLLNQGYTVEDGKVILLPYNKKGLYKVVYNRIPQYIINTGEAANDDTNIDLSEDLCALLPILIASYVWVDDEPEKAQYYLSLYRERAADIERRIYNATPVQIENSNGW